jgi:hypothetical protein
MESGGKRERKGSLIYRQRGPPCSEACPRFLTSPLLSWPYTQVSCPSIAKMPTIAWKPFIEPDLLEIGPNGRKVAFHTIPGSGWWRTGQQHSSDGGFVGVESAKPLKDVESFKIEASLKIKGADVQVSQVVKSRCALSAHQIERQLNLSPTIHSIRSHC